jgi:cytochrome c peroxidase
MRCQRPGIIALAAASIVAAISTGRAAIAGDSGPVAFSADERGAILAHGPWPQPFARDPSNRVSGNPAAIALGKRLFADTRLSLDGNRACTSCHDPARSFTDGLDRSRGIARVDRNAISLVNVRLNRWFGWDGAADSLWGQSLRPIIDARELGSSPALVQARLAADDRFATSYEELFRTRLAADPPDLVLVNVAKALAAFQETISSGRTAFDAFRDALARGDSEGTVDYPESARRGLRLFIGKGRCNLCHLGPNFSNGEFDSVGVRHFAAPGRVDPGRHAGIAALRASPFTLLGRFSDDAWATASAKTMYVHAAPRNWGEFRVPSLRNVADTAPYMHDGSLKTLEDVVRHYSEVDTERLHGEDGARLVQPLRLAPGEAADLSAFLKTLSGPVSAGP